MNAMTAEDRPAGSAEAAARKWQLRAALFFFEGHLSVSPSVMGAALELRDRGYRVDIFCNRPPIDVPRPDLPPGISLHEHIPWTRKIIGPLIERLRRRQLRRLGRMGAEGRTQEDISRLRTRSKALLALLELPQFVLYCRRRYQPADLVIAFDMTGLAAMSGTVPAATAFVYWSLEIMPLDEVPDPVSLWLKRHELRRLSGARAIVVQAPERRALFERDIKLPLDQYLEIPNGPPHAVSADLPKNFFSSRFPIPPGARVVLHAGLISSSYLSLEVAHTVPNWPPDFVLVFHERQHRDPREPYLQAVQRAGGERIFLSLDPVSFDKVDEVYAGADIGLVCYAGTAIDANQTTAWASSGKLVYCLRHGLPVVIVSSPCPSILADWPFGVWTPGVDGVGPALAKIAADYDAYAARARQAYAAHFDFSAAFGRLMGIVSKV